MINANLEQFLDSGWYNEATLFYKGYIYWCEGTWDIIQNNIFNFFVYRFKAKNIDNKYFERLLDDEPFKYEFEMFSTNKEDVKKHFLKAKIFEGKSFWEVEPELAWLDE